nr:hypothetical protein CFP56_55550 [Quercus suber]
MIKKKLIGSGFGFESDGGEEVGNGREEEMRKKREKRGNKEELTGTWMGAGRRNLGLVRSLKMGLLVLGVSFFFGCVSTELSYGIYTLRKRYTKVNVKGGLQYEPCTE